MFVAFYVETFILKPLLSFLKHSYLSASGSISLTHQGKKTAASWLAPSSLCFGLHSDFSFFFRGKAPRSCPPALSRPIIETVMTLLKAITYSSKLLPLNLLNQNDKVADIPPCPGEWRCVSLGNDVNYGLFDHYAASLRRGGGGTYTMSRGDDWKMLLLLFSQETKIA